MTVTLLCPGPSLSRFPGTKNLTIAVNRACLNKQVGPSYATTLGKVSGFRCDWWACSDYPMIRDYEALCRPALFTNGNTRTDITGKFSYLFSEILAKEELYEDFNQHKIPWTLYTATSALVLAAHLGATEIEVWGADFTGVADWDGHEYQWQGNEAWRTRGGDKWDGQVKNWAETCKALRARGIQIIR